MTAEEFWRIVGSAADPEALQRRLSDLPDDELVAFERLHREAEAAAYTWPLWGAAYIINDGCGDDTFDYFRAYLISLGRTVFEAAVADPDSLAGVDVADEDDWEEWMSPTMAVVHARTGRYDFADPEPVAPAATEPAGEEWDEDELPQLLPRLAAKHEW